MTATAAWNIAGCQRLPDSYTATVSVNPPGESEFRPSEVGVAFKRGSLRVDLRDGTALPGFALAWRARNEVFVMMPGREVAYRWDVRGVADRYGIPPLDEALVLPFTESPWMQGARLLGGGQAVDGQPCALWVKLTDRWLYRIWVHERWAIPLRFETARPEGTLVARYELHGVKPGARLSDDLFREPGGVPAPAVPPALP